jgi:peptidoglycan hydrolase CwlO-like protein
MSMTSVQTNNKQDSNIVNSLVPASVSLSSSMSYNSSSNTSIGGGSSNSNNHHVVQGNRHPSLTRIRKRPTSTTTSTSSISNVNVSNNMGVFNNKLLDKSTNNPTGSHHHGFKGDDRYPSKQHHPSSSFSVAGNTNNSSNSGGSNPNMIDFAKRGAKAGYLWKLGANVKEYKRRFFVLKPSTYLFYFVSESDTEPRGCIDLEKEPLSISPLQLLPDGRCRFQIRQEPITNTVLHDDALPSPSNNTATVIHLEARTQTIANEWITALTTQRFSYAQDQITQQHTQLNEYTARLQQLERENQYYRAMEQERDTYRDEATEWKERYQQLIQDILQQLHKYTPPEKDSSSDTTILSHVQHTCNYLLQQQQTLQQQLSSSQELNQQLSSDYTSLQKRMQKAERLITKLWEENCSFQMKMSKLKRDRKILASELQTLRHVHPAASATTATATTAPSSNPSNNTNQNNNNNITRNANMPALFGSAEKRLLCELEQDIVSSLKLHDKFLATSRGEVVSPIVLSNNKPSTQQQQQQQQQLRTRKTSSSSYIPPINNTVTESPNTTTSKLSLSGSTSTNTTTSLEEIRNHTSLLHMEEDEEEEENGEENDSPSTQQLPSATSSPIQPRVLMLDNQSTAGSSSNLPSNARNHCSTSFTLEMDQVTIASGLSFSSSLPPPYDDSNVTHPTEYTNTGYTNSVTHLLNKEDILQENRHEEPNPILLLLDEGEDIGGKSDTKQPITKTFSESFGCATTTLQCPLLDETILHDNRSRQKRDDEDVLHITFTSRKIGIQFQKVRISRMATASVNGSFGTITEDIRASERQDNPRQKGSSNSTIISTDSSKQRFYKTLMDLKAVASFATRGDRLNSTANCQDESILCQVPQPIDAVLVCGFCGFDEVAHPKPSIGSRLIAFDGISIEVGRWTFDSVRMAIQARKRPITLSFRNDPLSKEQRDIITRAAQEMKNSSDSTASSKIINSCTNYLHPITEDWFPPPPLNIITESNFKGGSSSSCSKYADGDYSTIGSNRSVSSFSDAGTAASSIVSLAVGPLVASILSGLSSKTHADFSPSWEQNQDGDKKEQTNSQQLMSFQAELL